MSHVNNFLSSRMMMGAAIVGLVGAAGVFIYEQVYAEKRRAMLVKEVAKLDKQVTSMKTELEALRELQKESQLRREKHKQRLQKRRAKREAAGDAVDAAEQSHASDSEYFTDYQSIVGTDGEMDSEEFYDVHDTDSDDTLKDVDVDTRNGRVSGLDEESKEKLNSPRRSSKNAT